MLNVVTRRGLSSVLNLTVSNKIATLELNNPPVNVFTRELLEQFPLALEKAEQQGADVVVVKSAREGVFTGGLDIMAMYRTSEEELRSYSRLIKNWFSTTYVSRLPIIVAINGASPAAGTVLATCADYRIMIDHPKYRIGLNEVHLGMAVPPHFCEPFAALVGRRRAEYLTQTGKMMSGKEALDYGLIDQLVTSDEFDDVVNAEAQNWIGLPIGARAKTKANMRRDTLKTFNDIIKGDPENGIPPDEDVFVAQMTDERVLTVMDMYVASLKSKSNKR